MFDGGGARGGVGRGHGVAVADGGAGYGGEDDECGGADGGDLWVIEN